MARGFDPIRDPLLVVWIVIGIAFVFAVLVWTAGFCLDMSARNWQ